MNYKNIYNSIITRAQNRTLVDYYEVHHIVPRCIGGSNNENNLVKLTPEEHYTAHLLLVKMYPGNYSLIYAANMMTVNNKYLHRNNKTYGWLRRRYSNMMSTNNPNAGGKARRAYIEKHGRPPIVNRDFAKTKEYRENVAKGKRGEKNINYGLKPWELRNSKNREKIRLIWSNADNYYDWWIEHQRSYQVMAKSFGYVNWEPSHKTVIRYFKEGWIPKEDMSWIKFNESCKL